MEKTIHSKEYGVFLRCLTEARKNAHMTQTQLAERLGETQSLVSKVERGERRVDIVELNALCEALGITLYDFTLHLSAELAKLKRKRK